MNTTIEFLSPAGSRFLWTLAAATLIVYVAVRASSGRANSLSKSWPLYVLRGLFILLLLLLLMNPVRVTELAGQVEPSQAFFLLDASESMATGNDNETRWDHALKLISSAVKSTYEQASAEVSLFRFGRRLKAVPLPAQLGLEDAPADDGMGVTFAKTIDTEENSSNEEADGPDEPDTQLLVALRQISSRFGRKPPKALVVFSDGRARDAARTEEVAAHFSTLNVPVHVVPLGNTEQGGDISLITLVVPNYVRKQSEVEAQAFLRSYGYDGKRVEVQLNAVDNDGNFRKKLDEVPVTIGSGFQAVTLTFRTDTQNLEAVLEPQPNEVSTDNNRFTTQISVDRTKIRVLYVEGSRMRSVPIRTASGGIRYGGPHSYLQEAIQEDVDIECVPVPISVTRMSLSQQRGTFPNTVAELSAFDAIILSDVPQRIFNEEQLAWIESWVKRRGGGLCMVGGRNSFAAGGWNGTAIERMLPVELGDVFDWQPGLQVNVHADLAGRIHPLFRISGDDILNHQIVTEFPSFRGANVNMHPKPGSIARVLAAGRPDAAGAVSTETNSSIFTVRGIREMLTRPKSVQSADLPLITVGRYGKGRTMAMAIPITGTAAEHFLKWGRAGQNQYYAKFWRNVTYWLTESSFIGRRRLVAAADKRYYGPGDAIVLTGSAFDESAKQTSSYRLEGVIEPQSFDNIESDYSIVRWPNNVPREGGEESPFVMWGETFEIPVKQVGGRDIYQIELPIAETLPSGTANQSLRLELTAYEDYTQVDSTSVPIQILHDPFEQQNPFPNHQLLSVLAEKSGGTVVKDADGLASLLKSLPVTHRTPELRKSPIWSTWWVLAGLVGLLSTEWCWRRWIGLA